MTAVWPAGLPQYVQERGYREDLPDQTVESQVDSGPPKVRRRFTKNFRAIQASIQCDAEQDEIFDYFYNTTLEGGTQPFLWLNPVRQALALFRFRRPAPVKTVFGGINVAISMNLWQLAQYAALRLDSTIITFDSTLVTFDEANRW
jgi:hypothetical protein